MSTCQPLRPPHMKIAFYISGHGFGHASRSCALIHTLLIDSEVLIVTNAPRNIFNETVELGAKYRYAEIDAGVSQPLAYSVDKLATFNLLNDFMKLREGKLGEEINWLKENYIDLVLSDAVFLACAAAKASGIPSILVTNFTFDSIYSHLSVPPRLNAESDELQESIPSHLLDPLVAQVPSDYAKADLNFRMPGFIDIPSFPNSSSRIVDIPLITRLVSPRANELSFKISTLTKIGVPTLLQAHKILLVSFGGQKLLLPSRDELELLPKGWIGILTGIKKDNIIRNQLPSRFYCSEDGNGYSVPELTKMANCCIGKLGYSTCSEVLSNETPFIYVPRILFIEEPGLLRMMLNYSPLSTTMLSRSDFENGNWSETILKAYENGLIERSGRVDATRIGEGAAEIITKEIYKFMRERSGSTH